MLLLLSVASLAAEPVPLKFRWSDGTSLAVEAVRTRVTQDGSGQVARTVRGNYTETVRKDRGRLVITTSPPTGDKGPLEPMDALALDAWPAWAVKKNGKYAGVVDPAGERARLEPLLATLDPGMAGSIRDRMTDTAMNDTIEADWDALVARWRNRALEPGTEIADVGSLEIPQIARPIRTIRKTTAERVPCDGARCLRIVVEESLDPVEHDAVLAAMNDGFSKEGRVSEVDVAYRWELITEPDTLIPHGSSSKRTLILAVGDGKNTAMVGRVDELVRIFKPAAAASAVSR